MEVAVVSAQTERLSEKMSSAGTAAASAVAVASTKQQQSTDNRAKRTSVILNRSNNTSSSTTSSGAATPANNTTNSNSSNRKKAKHQHNNKNNTNNNNNNVADPEIENIIRANKNEANNNSQPVVRFNLGGVGGGDSSSSPASESLSSSSSSSLSPSPSSVSTTVIAAASKRDLTSTTIVATAAAAATQQLKKPPTSTSTSTTKSTSTPTTKTGNNRNLLKTLNANPPPPNPPAQTFNKHSIKKSQHHQPHQQQHNNINNKHKHNRLLKNIDEADEDNEEDVLVNVDEETVDCFTIPNHHHNHNDQDSSSSSHQHNYNHNNNRNINSEHQQQQVRGKPNRHNHIASSDDEVGGGDACGDYDDDESSSQQLQPQQQQQSRFRSMPSQEIDDEDDDDDDDVNNADDDTATNQSALNLNQNQDSETAAAAASSSQQASASSTAAAAAAVEGGGGVGGEEKPKRKRKKRRSSFLICNNLTALHITHASQLFIYNWPSSPTVATADSPDDRDGGGDDTTTVDDEEKEKDRLNKVFTSNFSDLFCLQEQFSEYLGVKSFKRKYPDIYRRFIDIKEREYLKENKIVSETQCDLGLTALNLNDCLDLMADDYPDKYKELRDFLEERRRRAFANLAIKEQKRIAMSVQNHQKQLSGRDATTDSHAALSSASTSSMSGPGGAVKSDSDRMKELIKKAIKSVAAYNKDMQKEIREERRKYFDLQTMRLHCKTKPIKYDAENEATHKPKGNYPVALLAGQFQYHYEKYTPEEKLYQPLNTVMRTRPTPIELLYVDWKKKQQQQMQPDDNTTTAPKQHKSYLPITPSGAHHHHLATPSSSPALLTTTTTAAATTTTTSLVTPNTSRLVRSTRLDKSYKYHSSDDEASNDARPSPITNHRSSTSSSTASLMSHLPAIRPTPTSVAGTGSRNPTSTIRITASAAPTIAKIISSAAKICYVCHKPSTVTTAASLSSLDPNQLLIQCSSCPRASHPNCLDLNDELVDWECIRAYDWQCMECKRCTRCARTQDEDKMMFCDRCDRGFHTYCVGLGDEVPSGAWLCTECVDWREKVKGLSEKYNEKRPPGLADSPVKATTTPTPNVIMAATTPQVATTVSPAAAALLSSAVHAQLKSKINSSMSSSVKRLSTSTSGRSLDESFVKRGRGRPKGSLNKVKDGSSPKKTLKSKNSLSPNKRLSFDYTNANGLVTSSSSTTVPMASPAAIYTTHHHSQPNIIHLNHHHHHNNNMLIDEYGGGETAAVNSSSSYIAVAVGDGSTSNYVQFMTNGGGSGSSETISYEHHPSFQFG